MCEPPIAPYPNEYTPSMGNVHLASTRDDLIMLLSLLGLALFAFKAGLGVGHLLGGRGFAGEHHVGEAIE